MTSSKPPKRWRVPVVSILDPETGETDWAIELPQEALERLNWHPGATLSWAQLDNGDWIVEQIQPPTYETSGQ